MEQAIPQRNRRYTEEEYLAFEEVSDTKHEFRDGKIIPWGDVEVDATGQVISMAGGTFDHGLIGGNLGREIGNRLKDRPCRVVGSDVRVRVSVRGSYLYPDLSVVCGEPLFDPPDRATTLVNPQVVVEVLSPSTAAADRGEKFDDYMRIDSLREYVLVAQDRPWARSFVRGPDGLWGIGPLVEGLDATLAFRSLSVEVPLAEVYAEVRFPAEGEGWA